MTRTTLSTLKKLKQSGEKIACLTAYDATFAHVLEECGVDVLLVGDSLGMVIQGNESTLPVTIDDMVYHSRAVFQGSTQSLIITDMPFMSYPDESKAIANATRLMKEAGTQVVKLEGGAEFAGVISQLSKYGIPVCAHLGLLPQSVNKLGGYKVQGRDRQSAESMLEDAKLLEQAGAEVLVLECVPAQLAQTITESLTIPVIGIGAGPHCDGQVLVLHDMLGLTPGKRPRFTQDFLENNGTVREAVKAYVDAVKTGAFPTLEQSFTS